MKNHSRTNPGDSENYKTTGKSGFFSPEIFSAPLPGASPTMKSPIGPPPRHSPTLGIASGGFVAHGTILQTVAMSRPSFEPASPPRAPEGQI